MKIHARIWIDKNGKTFLGGGRVEILERIRDSGSIAKAAKQMRMSYKSAWDSVDIMNKLSAPQSLVVSLAGGNKSAGTKLTDLGEDAIRVFRKIEMIQNEIFGKIECDNLANLEQKLDEILKKIK